MNKSMKRVRRATTLTLGDLVLAVSSSSRNTTETAAAINDLFSRGRVALPAHRKLRVII